MMEGLYSNSNIRSDFVINPMRILSESVTEVFIASAFFTDSISLQEIIDNDCRIRLIVRLGYPTSPKALRDVINKQGVEIRYFSNHSFHPKLYIFGMEEALVGSANFTNSAMFTNQELMVSIKSDDYRFNDLMSIFSDYWDQARVLDAEILDDYEKIFSQYSSIKKVIDDVDKNIKTKIGTEEFQNINRGKAKKSKSSIYIDTYSKAYQETLSAFEEIHRIFLTGNYRKVPENRLPIRLEIDSFFSFVRDNYAKTESWMETEIGWNETNKNRLLSHIEDWKETNYSWLEETIVNEKYPLIMKVFGAEESILNSNMDEIVDALCVLHSFHDRLRFHGGGLDTLKEKFKNHNNIEDIKNSLIYLLYGEGNIIKRMCNLIYNPVYKINIFGESNVQELVGWVSRENYPVINGRTTKILRYYGFDVKQL